MFFFLMAILGLVLLMSGLFGPVSNVFDYEAELLNIHLDKSLSCFCTGVAFRSPPLCF